MKRLLIVLVVLVAVLVGGDFWARASAEDRVAGVVQSNLELAKRPEVSLGGFPFLPRMLTGHIPTITAEASEFTAHGVSIEELRVSLREIRFSAGELLSGRGTILAETGGGTATLTAGAVTKALRDQGIAVTARFSRGRILLTSTRFPGEIEATVSLEGNTLELHAADVVGGQALAMPLPEVVKGIRFTSARVSGSVAVVSFTLTDTSFDI